MNQNQQLLAQPPRPGPRVNFAKIILWPSSVDGTVYFPTGERHYLLCTMIDSLHETALRAQLDLFEALGYQCIAIFRMNERVTQIDYVTAINIRHQQPYVAQIPPPVPIRPADCAPMMCVPNCYVENGNIIQMSNQAPVGYPGNMHILVPVTVPYVNNGVFQNQMPTPPFTASTSSGSPRHSPFEISVWQPPVTQSSGTPQFPSGRRPVNVRRRPKLEICNLQSVDVYYPIVENTHSADTHQAESSSTAHQQNTDQKDEQKMATVEEEVRQDEEIVSISDKVCESVKMVQSEVNQLVHEKEQPEKVHEKEQETLPVPENIGDILLPSTKSETQSDANEDFETAVNGNKNHPDEKPKTIWEIMADRRKVGNSVTIIKSKVEELEVGKSQQEEALEKKQKTILEQTNSLVISPSTTETDISFETDKNSKIVTIEGKSHLDEKSTTNSNFVSNSGETCESVELMKSEVENVVLGNDHTEEPFDKKQETILGPENVADIPLPPAKTKNLSEVNDTLTKANEDKLEPLHSLPENVPSPKENPKTALSKKKAKLANGKNNSMQPVKTKAAMSNKKAKSLKLANECFEEEPTKVVSQTAVQEVSKVKNENENDDSNRELFENLEKIRQITDCLNFDEGHYCNRFTEEERARLKKLSIENNMINFVLSLCLMATKGALLDYDKREEIEEQFTVVLKPCAQSGYIIDDAETTRLAIAMGEMQTKVVDAFVKRKIQRIGSTKKMFYNFDLMVVSYLSQKHQFKMQYMTKRAEQFLKSQLADKMFGDFYRAILNNFHEIFVRPLFFLSLNTSDEKFDELQDQFYKSVGSAPDICN